MEDPAVSVLLPYQDVLNVLTFQPVLTVTQDISSTLFQEVANYVKQQCLDVSSVPITLHVFSVKEVTI